jgi:hypothetical protein
MATASDRSARITGLTHKDAEYEPIDICPLRLEIEGKISILKGK